MDTILHEHKVHTWREASENFIFRLERLLRYDGIENTVLSRDESWKPAMTVRRRLDDMQDALNRDIHSLPKNEDGFIKVYEPKVTIDENNIIRIDPIWSNP